MTDPLFFSIPTVLIGLITPVLVEYSSVYAFFSLYEYPIPLTMESSARRL